MDATKKSTKKASIEWQLNASNRNLPKGKITDFDKFTVRKVYNTPNGFSTVMDGRDTLCSALILTDLLDDLAAVSGLADLYTKDDFVGAEVRLKMLAERLDELYDKYDEATENTQYLIPQAGY